MKKQIIYILLTFVFIISCSTNEDSSSENENYYIDLSLSFETDWEIANQINLLINEHRTSIGLLPVDVDNQYASAYAVEHTKYMIDFGRINHDNFNYRSNALKSKGAIAVAENIAYGYTTAEDVVFAWLHSPSHKDIIEGNYTHTGYGVLINEQGRYYFTQIFYRK